MRVMFLIILFGMLGIAGFLIFSVRTVTHDPNVWHVEPLQAPASATPNDYRVALTEFTDQPVNMPAPIYEADARTLAQAFDLFVMAQPRVDRVAGSVEEAWITYVQRTETLQMPDYISVRFYDLEPVAPEADPAAPAEGTQSDEGAAEGEAGAETAEQPAPVAAPDRATIAIYSRSRFGYGDMGVNEARVTSWLQSLASFEE
ncbi:DUF1499 domain-containing protein [Oceanibium sediminis]|uniref:DUF1499 domain-containing protein n=1 Tax=Oceanibium sediminis TaxID=2026339 RepID=UPI000DD444F9|nr:DUF1499 domain-containing protein [Oceanibium sediminis]